MADDAVNCEPVSASNSLLTVKLTGNFAKSDLRCDFEVRSASEFNGFQPNSLRNRTGNFQTRIREFFSSNREIRILLVSVH
jgi:hypothetical protein